MATLRLGGITTVVTNPSEIALFKRRGWVEVVESAVEVIADENQPTPEEQNAAAVDTINNPPKTSRKKAD